ncbi:Fic family protein [Phytoactinopolyspora endophytica]|uniref:Fic family protein n=1 Tax=Phytoactinopolyspora endophytica TaxID=1642495 RepID=UPI00101BA3F5|nr:Fic family protein [Phytoactinopolyspora endophytica]
MRSFMDLGQTIGHVPANIVATLREIDLGSGTEALYRHQLPGLLSGLANRARVESVTASSAIEGVVVDDAARAARIVNDRDTRLRNRSEEELAGYRDALDYLFTEDWRPLNVGLLLHLHRLLYSRTAMAGGHFKAQDNLVVDRNSDGTTTTRFRPVAARDTDFYARELIDRLQTASSTRSHHPVLLIGLFVLDLLVIHPFEDGNGRVARVTTNALLSDADYGVVRYISMEQAIAESVEEYYQSLLESTHDWHAGDHDPWPWLRYFTTVLAEAYGEFSQRAAARKASGSKQERVRDYVLHHAPNVMRMADIRAALPGVSDQTIRLVLTDLRDEGVMTPDGVGRSAVWVRHPRRPPT